MGKIEIVNKVPKDLKDQAADVDEIVREFAEVCEPVEASRLLVMVDGKNGARYCECHLSAKTIFKLGTIDVPLDPEEQGEYRANRDIVEDHVAYEQMVEDALERRTFSNIVAEFSTDFDPDHPLKVIGGQHRFNAIKGALERDVNELHGLKVYFALDTEQRLDVQLISNTNIAASSDLIDRMQETQAGPELRDWCQSCALPERGKDFADKRKLGKALTVRAARTFIINYFRGRSAAAQDFEKTNTTPVLAKTGVADNEWIKLKVENPEIWQDEKLKKAGKEFAALVAAQRTAFKGKSANPDFEEKALNFAVMSGWAFVSGLLHSNENRLKRHYALREAKGKDPLNAAILAKGRHKTDPENYRGLGNRMDAKERGRFVELYYFQAENGEGITKASVELAIKKFHAKQAQLEVMEAENRGQDAEL